jgi:ribose transport system ATP-binding protein
MTLGVNNLYKSFAAPVLKGINLHIEAGSIHGLVGENGAGKSTLINILMGLLEPDSGELLLAGNVYRPQKVAHAFAAGFSLAAQELSLIDHLSVAENILLKCLPNRCAFLNRAQMIEQAQYWAERIGLNSVSITQKVTDLSLAEKQLVELAKALCTAKKLLILDEPTAALTAPQAEHLHKLIRECAAKGMAIVYVSHRLQDVLSVCDKVSVLREGEIQFTQASSCLTVPLLIEAMSGSSQHHPHRASKAPGDPRILVQDLVTRDLPTPISFHCRTGEIFGIAGLAGAGRSELLSAVYGLTPRTRGDVQVVTAAGHVSVSSPSQAVQLGIGMVAEDRKTQGIFAHKSIAFNLTIAGLKNIASRWGILRPRIEKQTATALINQLKIKCDSSDQAIARLSGGNQQKIIIGRWMQAQVDILLLDEPTRGVDPTAKNAIHDQLRQLRDQGATIIVVSSEIDELMSLCDRIMVLSNRQSVVTFDAGEWSHDIILQAAFSAYNTTSSLSVN